MNTYGSLCKIRYEEMHKNVIASADRFSWNYMVESIEELNGLICFNEKKNTIDEDEEYIEALSQQFNTYEERIMKKKERKKRKIQNS